MAKYWIMSEIHGAIGYLTDNDRYRIVLNKGHENHKYPSYLALYTKQGKYTFEHEEVLEWIKRRVYPPTMININQILKELHLPYYDESAIFYALEGRCSMDDVYIIKVPI